MSELREQLVPGEIVVLMDIYSIAEPEIRAHFLRLLMQKGLVRSTVAEGHTKYICTERGQKLVDMLCMTPLPKQQWVDPRGPTS